MATNDPEGRRIGRYLLFGPIASGGMATVHLGRLVAEAGFARTVAIKRLHPQLAESQEIADGLLDEARIVSRIQHPNVVPTLDLLADDDEMFLIMDYVHGESLSRLLAATRARGEAMPLGVVGSVVCGALHGLHAAHEARSESGEPLGIVHRDVSPENVLVGADGATRLLDFGVAKARGRLTTTRNGQLKGKVAYMAPEQLLSGEVSCRTDVYAAGIVLWEALTGRRLFHGPDEAAVMTAALEAPVERPSALAAHVPPELDALVLQALDRHPDGRPASARALAIAVEALVPLASPREVGAWVQRVAGAALAKRSARIARMESASATLARWPPPAPSRDEAISDVVTAADVAATPPLRPVGAQPVALGPASTAPRATPTAATIAALAGALLLGSGIAWWRAPDRARPAQGASPPASAAPAVVAPQAAVAPPPAASEAPPVPLPAPSSPPPARSIAAAPSPRSRPAPAAARVCTPPYTVDPGGVRHLKPECM